MGCRNTRDLCPPDRRSQRGKTVGVSSNSTLKPDHHGFDHVYTKVPDIHAARDALAKFGFSITSLDVQSDYAMGLTSVVFNGMWLAFSGPVGPEVPKDQATAAKNPNRLAALPEAIREQLVDLGLQPIVILSVSDLDAFVSASAALGFEPSDPIWFPRPTETAEGPAEIQFEMTSIEEPVKGTKLEIVGLKHLTRDLFFRDELLHHANGATRISEVTLPVAVSDTVHDRLSHFSTQHGPGSSEHLFGHLSMRLEQAASRVTIDVPDLQQTRGLLIRNGIPFEEDAGTLQVRDDRIPDLTFRFREQS